jgi:hypothetical protein
MKQFPAEARGNIDWTPLRDHISKKLSPNDMRYAGKIADWILFANFPEERRQTHLNKVLFDSVEEIPPCLKYKVPESIEFVHAETIWCGKVMIALKVRIERLIQNETDHFLHLHPERFDNVKRARARGQIDMPIVYLDDEGKVTVGDGRHRIIALHIYKFAEVEIAVPRDELLLIKKQFED